jgi:hypothetical protein
MVVVFLTVQLAFFTSAFRPWMYRWHVDHIGFNEKRYLYMVVRYPGLHICFEQVR